MLRAILISLGFALLLLWVVGLVDGSTWWMVWLDGIAAVLTIGDAALVSDSSGPIAASAGAGLLGLGLTALWIVGLATGASAWLTWFNFAFAGALTGAAGFAFLMRAFEPRPYSRRPIYEH